MTSLAACASGWTLTAALAAAASSQEPTLSVVLDRASRYAVEYEQRFSILVAEEDYYQRSERPMEAGNPSRTRGPSGGPEPSTSRRWA